MIKPEDIEALDLDNYEKRRIKAFLMRCDGLKFREIGEAHGVTTARARTMALQGQHDFVKKCLHPRHPIECLSRQAINVIRRELLNPQYMWSIDLRSIPFEDLFAQIAALPHREWLLAMNCGPMRADEIAAWVEEYLPLTRARTPAPAREETPKESGE